MWEVGNQPIAYFSRKLIPRETNWATMDKECLAIVEGIRHFAFYLTGVPFTVVAVQANELVMLQIDACNVSFFKTFHEHHANLKPHPYS